MRASRSRSVTIASAVAMMVMLSGCAPADAPAPSAPSSTPNSTLVTVDTVAVVGDSMSLGVNACRSSGPCEEASWALGTDASVNSIASRLAVALGSAPAMVSLAKNGATVGDRLAAIGPVVESGADLVLVQIGANDACTPSTESITSPDAFAAKYEELLTGIRAGLPDARIIALSVPNLLHLWEVGHTDPAAVKAWNTSPSCRSLLADADSDAPADKERRAAVDADVQAYNAAIAQTCAEVGGCFSDDGVIYDLDFTIDQISTIDHFHAAAAGQALVAEKAWSVVEQAIAQ